MHRRPRWSAESSISCRLKLLVYPAFYASGASAQQPNTLNQHLVLAANLRDPASSTSRYVLRSDITGRWWGRGVNPELFAK